MTPTSSDIFKDFIKDFKIGKSAKILFYIEQWPVADLKTRQSIGEALLKAIAKKPFRDFDVTRKVLRHIGTDVCTCPVPVIWKEFHAVLAKRIPSINEAAYLAIIRWISYKGDDWASGLSPADIADIKIHVCQTLALCKKQEYKDDLENTRLKAVDAVKEFLVKLSS